MSTPEKGHTHTKKAGGPDDGAGMDWFRAIDIVIWVSVAAIAVMGIEWLIGKAIREGIAASASRYLRKTAPTNTGPEA